MNPRRVLDHVMDTADIILRAPLVEIGGTIVLDLYAFLMQRMFGGPASNWKMVGKGASNEPARGGATTSGPQLTNSCYGALDPPVGGLFAFKFSSRPHPWKFGVKRFLALREVLARKWGGLF